MFNRWKQRFVLWWWYKKYHCLKDDDWFGKFEMLFTKLDEINDISIEFGNYELIQSHFSSAGELNEVLSSLMIRVQNHQDIETFFVDNLKSYFALEWFEVYKQKIHLTNVFIPPIFRTTKSILSYLKKRPESYSSYIRIIEPYFQDIERIALVVISQQFEPVNVKD